jgi:hypothetical protein
MPAWAVGFALEQPLHVVALAYSLCGILKQLEYKKIEVDLKCQGVFKISPKTSHKARCAYFAKK